MNERSELIFIGLGLSGLDGMTIKAFETLKKCDIIYAEFYTSILIGTDVAALEEAIGKKIKILHRLQVEEEDQIITSAKSARVAFITAGDTMAATTHIDLKIQAGEEGIPVNVIHGVSIFTACPTSLGLQPYKFGRTVTLPFLDEDYHPRSPYDNILDNKSRGLHSMILLDIKADELRYMTAHQALKWLLESEEKWKGGLITDETLICVAARIGAPDEFVSAGYPQDILDTEFGEPLHTLVIPGNLHFMEAYALVNFAGAPEEIIEDDD